MSTIFLRFPDDAAFKSLLPADFEQYGETGSPLPDGITALSIIGPIYKGDTYDDQGNVIAQPTQVPGWHVNALGTLPESWEQYQIDPEPNNPVRVFGTSDGDEVN